IGGEDEQRKAPSPAQNSRFHGKLLLVEDNGINQTVASEMLAKFGLSARIAANGRDALNALEEEPFDLIFMDVQMPVLDGLEATRLIRRKEEAAATDSNGKSQPGGPVTIVGMTAYAMEGDRERCLNAGMDDYLSKPIQLSQLETVLDRWLAKGAGRQR
ncbi:MAG: response regulator, partial [Opitutales bacterium]|nr:response regulator [Opitutales bacterium]